MPQMWCKNYYSCKSFSGYMTWWYCWECFDKPHKLVRALEQYSWTNESIIELKKLLTLENQSDARVN